MTIELELQRHEVVYMKQLAELITKHLSSTVEILAAVVIAISLLKFLVLYFKNILKLDDNGSANQKIRKFKHKRIQKENLLSW